MTQDLLDRKRFILDKIVVVLLLFTLVAAIYSNFISYCALKQSEKDSKYRYLTGVWNEIMKESVEHPEFNDKSKTQVYSTAFDRNTQLKYENYARWIGGFIEDLCINEYKKEKWLYYDPWIDNMLEIHRTWFIDHIDYYKYTKDLHSRLLEMRNKKPDKELEATGKPAP